jgi:hypothetical protein
MQQNHWRAATRDVVENFGVIADDLFHADDYDIVCALTDV